MTSTNTTIPTVYGRLFTGSLMYPDDEERTALLDTAGEDAQLLAELYLGHVRVWLSLSPEGWAEAHIEARRPGTPNEPGYAHELLSYSARLDVLSLTGEPAGTVLSEEEDGTA